MNVLFHCGDLSTQHLPVIKFRKGVSGVVITNCYNSDIISVHDFRTQLICKTVGNHKFYHIHTRSAMSLTITGERRDGDTFLKFLNRSPSDHCKFSLLKQSMLIFDQPSLFFTPSI